MTRRPATPSENAIVTNRPGADSPASAIVATSSSLVPDSLGLVTPEECANAYHSLMNVVPPSDYSFGRHLQMMFDKLARDKELA